MYTYLTSLFFVTLSLSLSLSRHKYSIYVSQFLNVFPGTESSLPLFRALNEGLEVIRKEENSIVEQGDPVRVLCRAPKRDEMLLMRPLCYWVSSTASPT